jgi:hypothetical protein
MLHFCRFAGGWWSGCASKIADLITVESRALVKVTHKKVCPYGHAARENIAFVLEVDGA